MAINNRAISSADNFHEEVVTIKPKFVPKRRAPYLMQEEVIKQKNESESLKNRALTEENSNNEQKIIGSQLGVNKESNYWLSHIKKTTSEETKENTAALLGVIKESDSSQPVLRLNFHEEVARLYGLQKKIAHFFVRCCGQRNQNSTGPITSETLCIVTGSTKKTIKKIVQRMVEKKLIKRVNGKRGKGGFASFEIEPEFIDVVRLQINLELNNSNGENSKFSNETILPFNSKNFFPEDWNRINLFSLIDAFKNAKSTQFFGKAQLKIIYNTAGNKLSSQDVQNSINSFAYGFKNYAIYEPYKNMVNPAAILLETLKNGDKWEEKRYLSSEETALYKVYLNVAKKTQENILIYYQKWKETDTDTKFKYYQSKMRSTDFYDDRVFNEIALDDYKKNIWPQERKSLIIEMIGEINEEVINKFDAQNN